VAAAVVVGGLGIGNLLASASDTRLADAVRRQNSAVARALLSQHVDVNAPQPDGATAIAWAAHWNDLEAAELLLRAGADVNTANDFGVTPLSLACTNGSAAMVERLLAAGADPNRGQATGETPLMTAARTGNVAAVKALLARGADVDARENVAGQTALMWSVSERHPEVARLLIEEGANVHARSKGGFTPLLFAAREGDVESARLLIAAGTGVDQAAPDGATPVVLAAASGREAVAIFLLEHGADANLSAAGYTALHAAVPKAEPDLVNALLAHGADPNARLAKSPAAVFGPSGGAGSEVASGALVLSGANQGGGGRPTDVAAPRDATPFWLAAKYVNVPVMKALIAAGADPSLTLGDGSTPMMAAAGLTQFEGPHSRRGDVSTFRTNWDEDDGLEAVRLLVDLGADVNATNRVGQTALHAAAYLGADRIVRFLVAHHANLNAQDQQGQTPFRVAQAHLNVSAQGVTHNRETAQLLRELGADTRLGVDGEDLLRQLQRAAVNLGR
jgi:ankyrin repeat protein